MPIKAPVTEIGYTQTPNYNWWLYENETTPELVWPQSIYVYDQMRRQDSQVGSVLRAVTETLLRTPWRIDPAGARARVTKFVADDLGLPIVGKPAAPPPRLKDRFSWPSHLREALLMLPYGHSYFEQVYRVSDDGNSAHLRKLAYRPAKTIERIDVASDGGLVAIKQWWTATNTRPEPIPVSRLVAYIHAKEGGNWLGTSILRNCYKNWLLKDRLLRVQAQTIERNGMGIPLYTAAETETDLTAGLGMATSWRAGEAAGSAVPYGATLKLVGVEGTLPDALPVIEYHDAQIARAVLAHFLNLGQQTGSWALGTTFADFFTMSLQTLAEQIRDTATQHIVEDLVDINFGENEPAPRLVFDEIGSRQAATAQAIKTLVDAGVIHPDQVLEESSRQQYGLPPADPATATLPPGAASATPPAPTQMGDTSPSVAARSAPKGRAVDDDGLFPMPERQVRTRRPPEIQAKYNPAELRDPGGEGGGRWVASPTSAAKDALKLAGKIDLAPDEHLVGSAKVDADAGGIRMALTEQGGHRMLRFGAGGEGYGKRNREEGIAAWDGNPSREPLSKAERARLAAEDDALDAEYESASPQRQEEIDSRQLDIREQLATDDEGFNGTAKIDEYGMRRLADRIRPALDEAIDQNKAEKKAWDEIQALEAHGNPDPDRLAALHRIVDRNEAVTFDEGIVAGSAWGDVHFLVELYDPSSGPTVLLGVKPKDTPDDWGDDKDWMGSFDPAETRKFLRLLDQQAKGVQAAAGVDAHPGGEELKHWWVYGPGAARWTTFTELYHQLREEIEDKSDNVVKAISASWFHLRFGYWPGDHRNVHAKYNPDELRVPGGKGGGQWVKSPGGGLSGLAGQDAIDATPARLVGSGYGPRHELFKPGDLVFSSGDPGWSPEQRRARVAALEGYQGSDFRPVNRSLRGMLTDRHLAEYATTNSLEPASGRGHLAEQVGLIDDVMDASALTGGIRVTRGTETGRGVFGDRLDSDLTGFEWTEGAYVSTTADPEVADYFTRSGLSMEIAVPAGTKAVSLSGFKSIRGESDEAEILLERGLRMRVTGDTGPGRPRQLEVEVIRG